MIVCVVYHAVLHALQVVTPCMHGGLLLLQCTPMTSLRQLFWHQSCALHGLVMGVRITVILFYFVLYLFSYTAVRTKIKRTNIFNNETFTRVSYMIWGAYEIKTARNNNVRNIFNAKYNQITV